MKHYVYVLLENNIPFYVGRTIHLKTRYYQHKYRFKTEFVMEQIDCCDEHDIEFLELFYIDKYREKGYRLQNNCNRSKYKNKVSILPSKETIKFLTVTQLKIDLIFEKSESEILEEIKKKEQFFDDLNKKLNIFLTSRRL